MATMGIFERAVQDPCAAALDVEDLLSEDYSVDVSGCPLSNYSIIQVPHIQVSPNHSEGGGCSSLTSSPLPNKSESAPNSPGFSPRILREPADMYNHLTSYNMDSGLSSTAKRKISNDHDPLSPLLGHRSTVFKETPIPQTPVQMKRKNSSVFIDQLSRQPSFVNAGIFATAALQNNTHGNCDAAGRSTTSTHFSVGSNNVSHNDHHNNSYSNQSQNQNQNQNRHRVLRVNSMSMIPSLVLGKEGRHVRRNSASVYGCFDSPGVRSSFSISIPSHVYGLDKYVCCRIDALTASSSGESLR